MHHDIAAICSATVYSFVAMSKFKQAFQKTVVDDDGSSVPGVIDEEWHVRKRKKWRPDNHETITRAQAQFAQESSSSSSSSALPERTFREVVADLFLTNKLSALHSHSVVFSGTHAGAQGAEDLAKAGAGGKHPQNLSRDLTRTLLKQAKWPKEYMAAVPIKNDKGEMVLVDMPFLLPHEVFRHLLQTSKGKLLEFLSQGNPYLEQLVREFCEKFNLSMDLVIPIGLHGDGAPFAAKMRDSLEQFSWSFAAEPSSCRIVFTAIAKSFVGLGTMDAILDIFSWSMRCLMMGCMPNIRHDGSEFRSNEDAERRAWAGEKLSMYAALVQIRGDWMFYKSTFNFSSWSNELICWLCPAMKTRGSTYDFRQCGEHAPWKSMRYKPGDFEAMLRSKGELSTIFKSPNLQIKHFLIDWLHAVDLGVSQSVIGNVLWEILQLCPGNNRDDKLKYLWADLKMFYAEYSPPSKLDNLTMEMLKLPGKPPKLRSKAAECRYLLPFAAIMAERYNDGSPHRSTVMHVIKNLLEVSQCLSTAPYNQQKAIAACRRCCILFVQLETSALQRGDEFSWRVKPKLHMFQELIEFVSPQFGNPRDFWTYKDEGWGGFLSTIASRRGGPKFASSTALNLLRRYRCCVTDQL